jgi:hypothetical protein
MLARHACVAMIVVASARAASGQQPTPGDAATGPVDPGLPFYTGELAQALLARLSPTDEAGPPDLKVEAAGADAVAIQVGGRTRVVAVGERTGAAAARIVALVIAELLSGDAEDPPAADDAAPAPAVTVANTGRETSAPVLTLAPPMTPGPSTPPRVCVTAGATRGVGSEELIAGTIDADVVLPLRAGWRLAPSAGLVLMPTRNDGTFDEVAFRSVVGRLLAAADVGPIDLLAGPFAAAYTITGANEHSGVLFGGEALARFTLPLSRRLSLVAAVRGDLYANRVRVRWADGGGYATPRVGLGIGVGVAWDWPS